jgi:hypothetical protein
MLLIIVLLILLFWVLFVLVILISSLVGFIQTRVPFIRTTLKDIRYIASRLHLSSQDIFYDLGSGDGYVVFEVERLTGAHAVGFELMWWTYAWAKLQKRFKKSKTEFFRENFFEADWSKATVIYAYLYPPLMGRVEEKFLKDCKSGAIAIVRDFPFPNIKPAETFVTSPELAKLYKDEKGRIPTLKEKLYYLIRGVIRSYKASPHDIYIYRR